MMMMAKEVVCQVVTVRRGDGAQQIGHEHARDARQRETDNECNRRDTINIDACCQRFLAVGDDRPCRITQPGAREI